MLHAMTHQSRVENERCDFNHICFVDTHIHVKHFFKLIFRYIRAEHYRYRFTKINSKEAKAGKWWKRTKIGNYLPPISLESVKHFMKQMDYTLPRIRKMRKH